VPYKLSPNKECVINSDTGKEVKCYPGNPTKARAHLAALRLNVPDAGGGSSKSKPAQSKATPGKTKPPTPYSKKKKMEALRRYLEAGARHSGRDMTMVQTIHDHAVDLGATCEAVEAK
jgi:hypothetical protein